MLRTIIYLLTSFIVEWKTAEHSNCYMQRILYGTCEETLSSYYKVPAFLDFTLRKFPIENDF